MSDLRRAVWIIGACCAVWTRHDWITTSAVFLALMALAPWSDD